ncbi:MAG: TetR family transcriptional regulator [Candidatus Aminicenantes bacterium]|nr:TetR family transcriptional regulator [Candidatus Aminicenantes bacterium]
MNINRKSLGLQDIPTQVKDQDLIDRRRLQIVDAAVKLFIDKGFHKTTTREIARESGISTGLLYEYVSTKEDVLYLVCDAIHAEVEQAVAEAVSRVSGGHNVLAAMIREYFLVCDRMSDHILLVYQETTTLPPNWRKHVLENEVRFTGIFVKTLKELVRSGDLPRRRRGSLELIAHNITVLGHMWTFRRWYLARHYTIEDYIKLQTDFILGRLTGKSSRQSSLRRNHESDK